MIGECPRYSGNWQLDCDGTYCEHTETIRAATFADAVKIARGRGWSMRPVAGQWVHRCPNCAAGRSVNPPAVAECGKVAVLRRGQQNELAPCQ